ncbi:putative arsenite methyltransferase [Podospora didyma]|uniref:Arsenite methyltransferase n=1 Tax=Podospora didyma TaxID=330526 RepID=A0AAE0NP54_9PEZI|nr:putative arsenite methyltransferase [Podospora didyma]
MSDNATPSPSPTNYKQGYSSSTLQSHGSRTVHSDAAFLLPHLRPAFHILDVGCGPGSITAGFASHVPEGSVTGIDINVQVLRVAQERTAGLGITFERADVLQGLPFEDGTFDVVYASQLLAHIPAPTKTDADDEEDLQLKAVREMRRVLKPGGGILALRDIADMHWYPARLRLDDVYMTSRMKVGLGGETYRWPGGDVPSLLRRAGFGKLQVGAGTTVVSGPEARKVHADGFLGRLEEGDAYRASWRAAGISDEEVEESREALSGWAETEDAWYVALQSEALAWKKAS